MSSSQQETEDFASIKDQHLIPSSPHPSHVSNNEAHSSQLLRLSRQSSSLTHCEDGTRRTDSSETLRRQLSPPVSESVFTAPSLAAIRQAAPSSPLFSTLMPAAASDTLGVEADLSIHSSASSLSVVSTEESSLPASASYRWAISKSSAAAAATALANASAPCPALTPARTSAAAGPASVGHVALSPAATATSTAVFTAEENSPHSSSQNSTSFRPSSASNAVVRPNTSPLNPLFPSRRRTQWASAGAQANAPSPAGVSGMSSSAVSLPHTPQLASPASLSSSRQSAQPARVSLTAATAPAALAVASSAASSPESASAVQSLSATVSPLAQTDLNSADPRSASYRSLTIPRRKLRESEVSFTPDLLHTAPSAPIPASGLPIPHSPLHERSARTSTASTTASPGADSLSLGTSACLVSPVTAMLTVEAMEKHGKMTPEALSTESKSLQKISAYSPPSAGGDASTLTRRTVVPSPPPLSLDPRHGGAHALGASATASMTSSRDSVVAGANGLVAAASATSSLGCFQSTSTPGSSLAGAAFHNSATHNGSYTLVTPIVTSVPPLTLSPASAHKATNVAALTATEKNSGRAADRRERRGSGKTSRSTSRTPPATTVLASVTTSASGTGANSTNDGSPATTVMNAALGRASSCIALSHDSTNSTVPLRTSHKAQESGSGNATLGNASSILGGGGTGGGDQTQWGSSHSGRPREDQITPVMNARRFFVPMNVVVVLNLLVTVVIVALLAILPLNEVSMRTITYITNVLSKGLSNSFAASMEANLFFLPLALRSFVAGWMLDQHTQLMDWTRHDMPLAMQMMCNLIHKTSSNSHLLYVGMYSPYSGYSAYCSPQYTNDSTLYGNYIMDNATEPRYRIGPDYRYTNPLEPLTEVYAMNPWEEAVEFGSPNNTWLNVAVPWYNHQVAQGNIEPMKMDGRAEPELANMNMSRTALHEETTTDEERASSTTVVSIGEGWWVMTVDNVSVITYTWPFIDYLGNLAMFTAALQPNGFYNLLAESLSSASLGKAMVLDPVTGMVLVTSWQEEPPIQMDNWDRSNCTACHNVDTLYADEVTDPLMSAAIEALGGRRGLFAKPFSVSEWEEGFRVQGKTATVFARRILFTDEGDDRETRTLLHLVMLYAIQKSEYSSNVEVVRTAILVAVGLTLAIIAVMDMALIYLFLRPLRNLAAGLQDAAQLRDGSTVVARRISAIKEVASMQHNFFLMNQQLMQMKAFVPQGVLGPTATQWSGSERATDRGSDFGNDDSFVFFTGPRPVDSREVSSVSAMQSRGAAGGFGAPSRGRSPQLSPSYPHQDDHQHPQLDEDRLPFELDAYTNGKALHATTAGTNAAESLRLNERALFEDVNRFRRRYCTVMVVCMHMCERDLVNQPKMELLISMFMTAAIPVILKDGGVIESQRPDTLTVSFGAHSRMAMHQTRGARCALEIIHRVNEYPALGSRVGCMVDVSEYYVGTFGAAQRNARVTYGVRMPTSLELVKLYKSLNTQILLTQKLAASLDRQFLVMPIDSLLFTLDSKSRVLYELRGSARSLPAQIPEAYVRNVIKAVRYGFNKMVHGEYDGALRYLEPFIGQDEQVRRLALACQSLLHRGVTKPYIRSIGRIKLSEANVLYDVEEQEQVLRAAGGTPGDVSLSTTSAAKGGTADATGDQSSRTSAQSAAFSSRNYLQRSGVMQLVPATPAGSPTTRTESSVGAGGVGGVGGAFTSSVSPVDPLLEMAIRRQHNKKTLRIISGSAPVDDDGTASLDGGSISAGANTVAIAIDESMATGAGAEEDGCDGAAAGGGGGCALFEMFIDTDDGDGPEVAVLGSTTHTVTEEAMGTGNSFCSVGGGSAQGMLVQASAAPGQAGNGGDGDGHGASDECVGDLPTTLEDYEGNTWFRSADRLGVGAFSVVYRGLSASGNLVALKCFQLLSRNVDYEAVSEEVRLFASLHHENIVQYVSVYISDTFFVEIMELVPGGSLDALLKSFGYIQKRALRRFLRDILRGLQYLHSMNIVHCDVKPHNVLLAMDGQCKLSDFGSAMSRAASSMQHIEDVLELRGTPAYLAPEVARGEIPTMKSDVFSLGVTVLELLDGALPWRFTQEAPSAPTVARGAGNSHTHANVAGASSNPLSTDVTDAASPPHTELTPQETYRRMWDRSAIETIFNSRPSSADGHEHDVTTETLEGTSANGDSGVLFSANGHAADGSGSGGCREALTGAGRLEGSESPKRVFPRFQRRGTCAPSSCPLIDDLEGLVNGSQEHGKTGNSTHHSQKSNKDSSATDFADHNKAKASLSNTSPLFGQPCPTTTVPVFGAGGDADGAQTSSSRPGSAGNTGPGALDGVYSGHSRPVSAEVAANGASLERILRNPTQLIRSIANGVVMPYIPDGLAADEDLVEFLKLCLHPDATQRASADQLLNHSWLM